MSQPPVSSPPPFAPVWAGRLSTGCILIVIAVIVARLTGFEDVLVLGAWPLWMAPGTAIMLLPIAVGILLRSDTRRRPDSWPVTLLALASVLLGGLVLWGRITDTPLAIDAWLSRSDGRVRDVRFGRVSAQTATMVLVLGLSLAVRRFLPSQRQLESTLALGVVVTGTVVLHGYFLGSPLFADGTFIPVAAISALILVTLGIAQQLLAGAKTWPLSVFVAGTDPSTAASTRSAFRYFAVLLSGFVLASGYFSYQAEREQTEARTRAAHAIATDSKAAEISQWVGRHLSAANALRALALGWDEFEAMTSASRSRASRPAVERWLAEVQRGSDYEAVALFSAGGLPLVVSPDSMRNEVLLWSSRVRRLPREDRVVMDESDLGAHRWLTFWVPLYAPERQESLLWLALTVDARDELIPMIAELPTIAGSGNALLWRRDGDSAETINDVSRDGGAPQPVRVPLDSSTAVAVANGFFSDTGVLAGRDLGGVSVMAYARQVPGTDWRLVLQVDRDELSAPVRRIAVRTTLSSLLLLLVLAGALFALWYQRDRERIQRELGLVQQREENVTRLVQLDRMLRMRSAADVALVRAQSEDELFQSACDAAVQTGGYRMAWVGLKELDAECSVRPVAFSGDERGYLDLIKISWAEESPLGRGPTGRCIRSGSIQSAQHLGSEANFSPWRESARERGYASSCAIPLKVRGDVVGALMLYSSEPFAFHEEEVSLLGDIGDDLSFGLAALRDQRAIASQQAQLALFREVMERSKDAVFLTDIETAHFIDFNEAALHSLGYSSDELRERGPVEVVHDLTDKEVWRARADEVMRGVMSSRRTMHRRKNGTLFPVDVSLTAIETAGRRLVLSIARDISDRLKDEDERERLQAQFLRSQRMESVGRLAGGVAHDFNNLLTVINGTADLAMADLPADSPIRADLEDIRSAGTRAATLTRQLLAFSRQQVLRPEHLDLNEVVPAFLGMLKRVIGEDIAVEVRLGSVATNVVADHGQLEQVLMNLCVNARDAMPRGGRLTLEVEVTAVNEAQASQIPTMTAGQYVRLSVVDTGEGMSVEVQSRLFEPFFTTKEPGRGTGLGLSTVYGIVKQSGGHIGLISSPGHGTRFNIYLPVARPGAEVEPSALRQKPSAGSETILVVEDEEAIRFVVRRVLERSGYKVLEAPTGADALKAIRAHTGPLDLVMTDLVMPGMSGIELARTLRREHPALRILLASGYSQETVSSDFDTAREWQLISKPYSVKDLLSEIRRVLDGAV